MGGSLIPTHAFFPVQAKTFMYKGHYRNKRNLLISSKVQELKKKCNFSTMDKKKQRCFFFPFITGKY